MYRFKFTVARRDRVGTHSGGRRSAAVETAIRRKKWHLLREVELSYQFVTANYN